jgi:hypothetical protein
MVANGYDVFVSVGGTANDRQEGFVRAVEDRLRSEGITPHTIGRNTFSADSPLRAVMELMDRCCGTVVIALERTYFPAGREKRGGPSESILSEARYPTPWNQVEAAISYARGLPLLVIVENGLEGGGLLERGHDWHIQWVEPNASALSTLEFNGVLSSWKQKMAQRGASSEVSLDDKMKPLDQLTVAELVGRMKTSQLWSVLVALAALIGGAFALGAQLFHRR